MEVEITEIKVSDEKVHKERRMFCPELNEYYAFDNRLATSSGSEEQGVEIYITKV